MSLEIAFSKLQQYLALCQLHTLALRDALKDIETLGPLSQDQVSENKSLRRILDQFAYRYTRLQDDMGSKLLPALLEALGEDIASLANIDRLNRLEQLGWISSSEEWLDLRRIRNEFTHDYPQNTDEKLQKLTSAFKAAQRLQEIFSELNKKQNKLQRPKVN